MSSLDLQCGESPRKQQGAILVTSLLLLLIVTLISATAMQMATMQERMAGNTRDTTLALQGAEAALRDGERQLRALASRPVPCSSAPCQLWKSTALTQVENLSTAWWNANARSFGAADTRELVNLSADPAYVIEEIGFVRTDGGIEQGLEPPPGRDFYRISARSTGGSGFADTVLQTTYTRKF